MRLGEMRGITHACWISATLSNNGTCCVESSAVDGGTRVAIRNSTYRRDPSADLAAEPVIVVASDQWDAFLAGIRTGVIVDPADTGLVAEVAADGSATLTSTDDGTTLSYTEPEWTAFVGGVRQGEMTTEALLAAV